MNNRQQGHRTICAHVETLGHTISRKVAPHLKIMALKLCRQLNTSECQVLEENNSARSAARSARNNSKVFASNQSLKLWSTVFGGGTTLTPRPKFERPNKLLVNIAVILHPRRKSFCMPLYRRYSLVAPCPQS